TQVSQNPDVITTDNQKLSKDISQLMKISNDLQEITMSMRMVPIRATFERMARMVRDLARKCDKQIEFSMTGEDTELDKNVVEEIVDPLTHMVRNACDHGVETPEDRTKAGKSEKGQVSLHAYHKGGNFVIELRDDGSGINRDRVYEKAVERGLFADGEQLSDEQVYDLIFHPGLSTADKISDVSGRGVGMDVVRRNIERLRGKVEVQSAPGKGSVFAIRLPLTLAIIDGMVIGVGQERYILPLTSIISSLRPVPEQICTVMEQGEMVKVQDELFPLVRMHERFDIEPRYTNPCEGLVVLIEAEGNRCGLLVDELVGLQQVVIKGLNEDLRNDPCLSGCAILGDGRIGLILDANGLVEHGKNANNAIYQ
ncbi:MAG: chemotaxis protein CheA, partial [Candidatus Latescibacteria bacterium]|nr:chemotaxis protein CheA [Candidatus Latescibacterota bacterium]